MAQAVANNAVSISFGRIVKGPLAALKSVFARQSAYSRTFKELSQLSSRELNDIGISRDMIGDVARAEAERF